MGSGFGQFCPVAVASEVIAARWTPIILRELLAGSEQFNDIHRGIPLISRPLLVRRLRELAAAGVIRIEALERGHGHRYRLTEAGGELRPVIEQLAAWGQRWTARVDTKNLDPRLLMWNLRRRVALDRLPPGRTVVQFNFTGAAPGYRGPLSFWLILASAEVGLCLVDPGFEVDLFVEAALRALARVWLGDATFVSVLRSGELQLFGPSSLTRAFPSWWLLSPFAGVERPGLLGEFRPEPSGSKPGPAHKAS